MSCPFPNITTTPTIPYQDVVLSLAKNLTCGTGYLRPDVGGSLPPWILTVLAIVLELPVVIVRIARWEKTQLICLFISTLGAYIITQAYISTHLSPDKVLVWTPISLVLPAGAMIHQLVLLVEMRGSQIPLLRGIIVERTEPSDRGFLNPLWFRRKNSPGPGLELADAHELADRGPEPDEGNEHQTSSSTNSQVHGTLIIMVCSLSVLVWCTVLEIRGLVAAVHGLNVDHLELSWCSPIFTNFSLVVLDGNCNQYKITQDVKKGIGCIKLRGTEQRHWLRATIVLTSIFLVTQLLDLVLMLLVNSKYRIMKAVKMKRPWFSMIFGILWLVVILVFGVVEASNLPTGITERVWVVMKVGNDVAACTGNLTPAGLRGAVIGWTDGLLKSWGAVYFGSSA
ncbi:hypothetical protein BKA64DRAFT_95908 [Cadophora sp. MPI-SDFR-AT-0126]|nr:hypothetical protein BKA64DRAFT_95908 [Leotiomycetes sp. MPI-SDFR-AT-0126]